MSNREGRTPSQRQLRVGEELRHLLSQILGRDELRDPALQGRTITVTEVRISPDLKNATAFIVPLGGEHEDEVLQGLKRCAGFLRSACAHSMSLRYTPHLFFELDHSFDEAQRIEKLLLRPDVARDLDRPQYGATEDEEEGDSTDGEDRG